MELFSRTKPQRRDLVPPEPTTYPLDSAKSQNFFAHVKTFRRVATRYDKLAETCMGWVLLAVLIKFGF